ncbi:hypothetical protein D6C78_08364 [Aureobasidium pullulans]|uniref:Uncharacterized protein n=1 Tax=Aureobasidium pullulans TaxID=5580 RepID=A0A4T0BLE4_AURPU|nr:hypothetical protein D6C78_08364 [Aureobasidium pullulans]
MQHHVCESLWTTLEDEDNEANHHDLAQTLISIIKQEDAFVLARLVIPKLRMKEPEVQNPFKQEIITQTMAQRTQALALETSQQSDFDNHLYRQEKEVFSESEMYRASLLLFRSAAFDGVEEQEILQWLANRPRKPTDKSR